MPYEWIAEPVAAPQAAAPVAALHLWPYRSLPRRGFVWFIAVTVALVALPLFSVIGSPVLWGLLPFLVLTIWGLWAALSRSYRDGETIEELTLWHDRIEVVRHDPKRPPRQWSANPYWVRVILHETGGPVPNYLTLKGNGREVELGAFLSPDERLGLRRELLERLAGLGGGAAR